jgi:glycerol-3-phosphate dehydrogenase
VVGSLSGPTNALEVARGAPAAMVLAASGPGGLLADVQSAISGSDPAGLHERGFQPASNSAVA